MKTEILCIIDRSGSMASIRADAEGGFNTFIEEQKKVPGEAKITLSDFDDKHEVVYQAKPLNECPAYTLVPRGSTALYDAIGRTLEVQGKRIKDEGWAEKVIVAIVTDGEENASREFTGQRIQEMTKHAQDMGWSFIYLAANVDVKKAAHAIGINLNNPMNLAADYQANAVGTRGAYMNLASATTSIRGGGNAQDKDDKKVA